MSSDNTEPNSNTGYCIKCGEAIDQQAEICPECGVRQHESSLESSVDQKHCTNCGNQIDLNAELCPDCGVRQDHYNSSDSSAISEEATTAGNAFSMMVSYYRKNSKRGIFHILVGLLTGGVWFGWFFWFWLGTYMEWKDMDKLRNIHNSA